MPAPEPPQRTAPACRAARGPGADPRWRGADGPGPGPGSHRRPYAEDGLHLTTRQNVELHRVHDRNVPDVLDALARYGLPSRSSSCGHTLRNVTCSEDAGVGLDEPFDCFPDARAVSDAVVERSRS